MRAILLFFLKLLCYEVSSKVFYFHEPSHIELTSPDGDTDFGFSLDYQKKTDNLVVGSPRSDLNGKVFTCTLTDVIKNTKKNITCNRAKIDIDKLAEDFRKPPTGIPDHPCLLGASLAVTDDYIFTCAPLCSKYLRLSNGSSQLGAFGTCFVYNGQNATRYCGLLENYDQKISDPPVENFYGGVGWTTFVDPINNLILIAKSILTNHITYLDMDEPLKPVMEKRLPRNVLSVFTYKGVTFASGIFFNDEQYLYAFSMKKQKQTGGIAFMYYEKESRSLQILNDENYGRPILIRDDDSISMYGTALHSVDLNNDNFSELIVGAPGFSTIEGGYELGAIYLYMGGGDPCGNVYFTCNYVENILTTRTKLRSKKFYIFTTFGLVIERKDYTHRITAIKDGARFGTSIASTDLDGDGLAEMFVSAPYGEKEGAVFILSGYELRQLLDGSIKDTLLSSLMHTQTIYIKNFKTFGYSLHAFERNGASFLAVGSPSTGKVVLYRSLSLVTVSVLLRVQGDKSVREQDTNFTVIVKVKMEHSGKSLDTPIKLFLSTEVTGDHTKIHGNTTNEIELSKIKPENTYDVVVLLGKTGPGDYKFTARVTDKEPFMQKDYDPTLVKLTPQSQTISVLEVPRHCKGIDCVPRFLTNFEWSGRSDQYMLGSSDFETMQVVIVNEGNSTYDSCAWIKVTGAQIAVLECDRPDGIWYKCPLRIERDGMNIIYIRLDMSRPTSKDKSLNIEVNLFNHCASFSSNATITTNKEIIYLFNNEDIEIEGSSTDRNFTDSEIHNDVTNAIINVHETYKITNNATVSWKGVVAILKYRDLSFVKNYMIIGKRKCEKKRSQGFVQIKCIINVDSMSTDFIRTSVILSKTKLIPFLRKRKLVLNSTLELHFESADAKFAKYTTTIFVQRDVEFWENQNIIIPVAVIVGLFIVGTLAIILYKIGFFKRKGKKKVKTLRDSIRKGTFRRPSTAAGASEIKTETQEAQL